VLSINNIGKMKERRGVGMSNSIFRKIMVATDGSELVKKAVDTAIEMSKLGPAKLYAVYVISMGDYYSSMPLSIDVEWIKAMEEHLRIEGEEAIAYVENEGRAANVEVEPVILEGNPAGEIVDFAEEYDIELIVMGTHGKSGIQRFLIGSVAENVVRHSKKSVLVVKG
jgi:nucleotide-binding universal stress UspA family protein